MPPSSAKVDKPAEFEDARKLRPTSLRRHRQDEGGEQRFARAPVSPEIAHGSSFVVGPSVTSSGAAFVLGGTF
jgi:hypothetical protein